MKSKIEAHIVNDPNSEDLSLAEQVFHDLQIHSTGFHPGFFTPSDLSALALTSKTLKLVVSPELNMRAAEKLLTHVVLGEQTEAEAMIKANPNLLLIQSKAIDYSGRTIIATPFQAALGAGDKPMWNMMLPYFEGLEQGEALRQFHEQFPNGIKDDVSAEQLKIHYNALAFAIINDEDHGLSAIEGFRKALTSQKKITKGKHFNLQHLLAAYQAYIDNFKALVNWDNRDIFWQKVVGYVQRQMTAYDAQINCSGLKNVLVDESIFARIFEFSNGGNFFPLADDSGLGFDFGCYSYGPGAVGQRSRGPDVAAGWLLGLSGRVGASNDYVEQKQMRLLDLESHLSKECIISPINCF